jgi:hypothetical protein
VAARPHVAPGRAGRRRQLERDLPEEEHERARDVEPVGQEGPVARVRALVGVDAADREDRLVGLARKQVAAAGAAADEQALAGRVPGLDLGAGGRRGASHEAPRLLLDPAEGRDVVVGAQEDPGLAGPGLRGEVGLPFDEPVAVLGDPAGHVGRAAVAHRVAQDGKGEPVDLQEDDPRHVGALGMALTAGDATGDADGVLVVVVGAQDDLQAEADRRDHQGGQQRVAERADHDGVRQGLGRQPQQQGVGEQDQHEADSHHVRQAQGGEQGREHSVERRDGRRHRERCPRRTERDAR